MFDNDTAFTLFEIILETRDFNDDDIACVLFLHFWYFDKILGITVAFNGGHVVKKIYTPEQFSILLRMVKNPFPHYAVKTSLRIPLSGVLLRHKFCTLKYL